MVWKVDYWLRHEIKKAGAGGELHAGETVGRGMFLKNKTTGKKDVSGE